MSLRVVLRRREDGGQLLDERFEVDEQQPLTFGRSPSSNRLHITDEQKTVSGVHGQIECRGGDYFVVDLGSTNGTSLEGETLSACEPARLSDGNRITVGGFELQVFTAGATGETGGEAAGDLQSTLVSLPADAGATSVFDSLCAGYVRRRRLPAAQRRAELAQELERALAPASPAQKLRALRELQSRVGGSGDEREGPDGGDGAALGGEAEALLQVGLRSLQRLAAKLVAGESFRAPREVEAFAVRVETFFSLTLEWLARSMEGRAEFERQFGAEVTLVFQRTNNMLKGQAAADLGRSLLDWRSDRELEDVQKQLNDLFRDLSQHQLGLLAGVKEAVAAVMERLSPDAIESLAQKDAGWLTTKGAKAWEIYQKIYSEFFEEKSKLFHEVISPAIRDGYLKAHDGDPGAGPAPVSPPEN
ncbi:MAG: FHA domain-containing protein [bacterium]|nr:FHA domain-containing protein [bacterium]